VTASASRSLRRRGERRQPNTRAGLRRLTGLRDQRGQALVINLVFLTVLLGMAALVLDVGAWYRAQRAAQSAADAAALAAAQELPDSTGNATSRALEFASKNGGGLTSSGITFSSKIVANDTVAVRVQRPTPTFFAKLFGLKSVTAAGRATARAGGVEAVRYVAPIVVHYKHSLLNCTRAANPTCAPNFGATTTLTLSDLHSPGGGSGSGAFGLINLDQGDSTGTASAGTLADWLANGFGDYMQLGRYFSAPSANFNNSQFLTALDGVLGKEVLFPVYRLLNGPGSNAQYDIIGWVGFVITSYNASGSSGTLTGSFTRYVADGIQVGPGGGNSGLGVTAVELVE
jgi:Flp pilus assembly protein TadG